jgi:hypothetical protein
MRHLTASQKVAQLEHRIAQLEKQALLGILRTNKKRALEILKAIREDIQTEYDKWLYEIIPLKGHLEDYFGRRWIHTDRNPYGKFEFEVSPHDWRNHTDLKSHQGGNKFTVEMYLSSPMAIDVTIVFDESSFGNRLKGKDPSFTVYFNDRKAFHLKDIRRIQKGMAWQHALKALKMEFRELKKEIEDYTREFVEKNTVSNFPR